MIYKLDHVTFVISKTDLDISREIKDKAAFCEYNVINPSKVSLVSTQSSLQADLYYHKGEPDIEYIAYEDTGKESELAYDCLTNTMKCRTTKNPQGFVNLLSSLGFVDSSNDDCVQYSIMGGFDNRSFSLMIENFDAWSPVFLDDRGWNCPCFLVDSVQKTFESARKLGAICSVVDSVVVNNRLLDVGFLRHEDSNIIIEFISPGKRNS